MLSFVGPFKPELSMGSTQLVITIILRANIAIASRRVSIRQLPSTEQSQEAACFRLPLACFSANSSDVIMVQ